MPSLSKFIKNNRDVSIWWVDLDSELGIHESDWRWGMCFNFIERYNSSDIPKFCYEDWYLNSEYALKHFVYTSQKTPSKLAFTENEAKGKKDIQTIMAVGRYLNRFFSDVLTPEEIKEWANLHRKENTDYKLKFADTADEIEYVYEHGPNSCMSGGSGGFSTNGIHPARVYGGPDTRVAYLERDERITARSVIVEKGDRKEYVRCYGDDVILEEFLEEAGYSEGDLDDCYLLHFTNDSGYTVIPFLDGAADRYDIITDGNGNQCVYVTDDGEYIADRTDGLGGDYNPMFCEYCDNDYPEEDGCYVDRVSEWVCHNCQENHFVVAIDIWGNYVLTPNDDVIQAEDGTYFTDWDAVSENDYGEDHTDYCIYPLSDLVSTDDGYILESESIEVTDEDGDTFYDHKSEADNYYTFDGKYYTEEAYLELTEDDEDD